MEATITYLISFLWGLCILFSLIGWGGIINQILFPTDRIDWGQRAAFGIAFSILVGGILNVTWCISQTVILLYLGTGLFYWLFDLFKNKRLFINSLSTQISACRKNRILAIGIFIVFFLVFLRYSSSVSNIHLSPFDDYYSYLLFPKKMLQQGSIGRDPFHTGRLCSTLGGQAFLHTFALSVLPERNSNIIDAGIGLIIAVGLIAGYLKKKKIPVKTALFILTLFLLVPPPKLNISTLMIGLALFLSLFRILDWEGLESNHFVNNAFITALIASAICTTKTTLIPTCVTMLFFSYLFYILKSKIKKKAIYEFIAAITFFTAFLLPWMISLYQSSGTLLYPILGEGHTYVKYLELAPQKYTIAKAFKRLSSLLYPTSKYLYFSLVGPFVLLCSANFRYRKRKLIGREALVSFIIGTSAGTIIIPLMHHVVLRYSFSFLFAATIILIITLAGATHPTPKLIAMVAAGMILQGVWSTYDPKPVDWTRKFSKNLYIQCISYFTNKEFSAHLISDQDRRQYAVMQESIPRGKIFLAAMFDKPFLFDFKRNKIFIFYEQVGPSLPPGIPYFKGSKALVDYLVSNSIRYVAYSYKDKKYSKRGEGGLRRWLADLHYNFMKLANTRKIYDDGTSFVLDLLSHRKPSIGQSKRISKKPISWRHLQI